jgi:NADPH2:quinone reductase
VVHAAAGGVGLWLLQLLRVVGAGKIIALASTPEKLALTKQFGATHTISSREDEWVERVKEIAVDGVEAVFDGVGRATFEGDLKVLKRKGSLVLFGNASGVVEPFQLNRLSEKNLKVMRPKVLGYLATDDEWKIYSDNLVKLLVEKKVEVRIHKTYSLAEAIQAHQVCFFNKNSWGLGWSVLTIGLIRRISRDAALQENFCSSYR